MANRSFPEWKWQPPKVPSVVKPRSVGPIENRSYPRWMAPLVGIAVGVAISLRCVDSGNHFNGLVLAAGIGMGFLAGLVLWLMDAPRSEQEQPATVAGWVLVILSWIVMILPGVNVLASIPAFLVNRRVQGWPNKASRAATGISVLVSTLVVVCFVFYRTTGGR